MSKVPFVVTGARDWTLSDGTQHPTGYWAEELVAPYRAFTGAGHEVVVATPGGGQPVVDEASLAPDVSGGQDGADEVRAAPTGIGQLAGGTSPFSGYRLTGSTNAEEAQAGLADKAPWLLQDRLVALGCDVVEGEPWAPNVVVDRSLYTGQNPASSGPLAERMLQDLPA